MKSDAFNRPDATPSAPSGGAAAQVKPFKPPKLVPPRPRGAFAILAAIMIGLTLWGSAHAYGAYQVDGDFRRPLIVLGCLYAFVGTWLLLLVFRRPRVRRPDKDGAAGKTDELMDTAKPAS